MSDQKYQGRKGWVCPVCKKARAENGCDPCIPNLPGVLYACCGHGGEGVHEGYIYFENGIRIGFDLKSVSYEDGRESIIVQGRQEAEIERLRIENWQLKGALGYPVPADIPESKEFKCGLCDARRNSQ